MKDGLAQDREYIGTELEELQHHWGGAYFFQCPAIGTWLAYRRDNQNMISAPDPERLLERVRGNYAADSVPRQMPA